MSYRELEVGYQGLKAASFYIGDETEPGTSSCAQLTNDTNVDTLPTTYDYVYTSAKSPTRTTHPNCPICLQKVNQAPLTWPNCCPWLGLMSSFFLPVFSYTVFHSFLFCWTFYLYVVMLLPKAFYETTLNKFGRYFGIVIFQIQRFVSLFFFRFFFIISYFSFYMSVFFFTPKKSVCSVFTLPKKLGWWWFIRLDTLIKPEICILLWGKEFYI